MKNRGPLLVLCCYLLFGILPIYWKIFVTMDPYFILANRVVWSLLFAVILILVMRQGNRFAAVFHDKKLAWTLCGCGALLVVNWGTYIIAVNTGHVIEASLAYYLNPIMSVILGCVCFKETLTGLQKMSVVLATVGVLYAIVSHGVIPWLALLIGGSFACYGALKKTVQIDGLTSLSVECAWMFVPALLFGAWLVSQGQFAQAGEVVTSWQWLLIPTTGIITAAPLMIYSKGIQTTDYTLAGVLMYINPTLQFLCGIFFFHEAFTEMYAVMFAFVWAAVALFLVSAWLTHREQLKLKQ
mgnify:CR=1 FL=1